ncbi:hypothetical protein AZZ62_000212, partial [Klebsiella variicola]
SCLRADRTPSVAADNTSPGIQTYWYTEWNNR